MKPVLALLFLFLLPLAAAGETTRSLFLNYATTATAAAAAAARVTPASKMPPGHIYTIPIEPMKGAKHPKSLKAYEGKVLLIVNVASKCGFTRQYEGLEQLYRRYKSQGLVILGFPCNDFGGQEPGTEEEIAAFCKSMYDVSFPIYAKVRVTGDGQCDLYRFLTTDGAFQGEVKWNFQKFLIDRKGNVAARFTSNAHPMSVNVVEAVEKALAER